MSFLYCTVTDFFFPWTPIIFPRWLCSHYWQIMNNVSSWADVRNLWFFPFLNQLCFDESTEYWNLCGTSVCEEAMFPHSGIYSQLLNVEKKKNKEQGQCLRCVTIKDQYCQLAFWYSSSSFNVLVYRIAWREMVPNQSVFHQVAYFLCRWKTLQQLWEQAVSLALLATIFYLLNYMSNYYIHMVAFFTKFSQLKLNLPGKALSRKTSQFVE